MNDTAVATFRKDFVQVVGGKFPVLYHGTIDLEFAIGISQRFGFHSVQAFRKMYCNKALGGTAVYGPGIYLTDQEQEARSYGANILEFRFSPEADYVDLHNPGISKAAVKSVAGGKQTLLAAVNLDMLIRVTKNYYVLRSPILVLTSLSN